MEKIWKWTGAVVCLTAAMILSGATASQGQEKISLSPQSSLAKSVSKKVGGRFGTPMVLIPAGYFMMGSPNGQGGGDEHPRHKVWLDAFYMDKYPVTFDQYDKFCEATGRVKPDDNGWGRGRRPVINVFWDDANAYCKWAGKRLPTEAEWEKAARGGTTTQYFFGDDNGPLRNYAWYNEDSGHQTHPVGEKKPNPYGLYDILGNAWEWCSDWYDENYYAKSPVRNPRGPASGQFHVLRGGSWGSNYDTPRSAYRVKILPLYCGPLTGFRCARSR